MSFSLWEINYCTKCYQADWFLTWRVGTWVCSFTGLYLKALSRTLTRHEASGGLHTLAFSPPRLWLVHGSGQTIVRNGDSGACLHFLACRRMMVSVEALAVRKVICYYTRVSCHFSRFELRVFSFTLRQETCNTGNLSFNLIWCGCYFNSPQKAPVGLWSVILGSTALPAVEFFQKDLSTFHLQQWNEMDESWMVFEAFMVFSYQLLALCLACTCGILIQCISFLLTNTDYFKDPMQRKNWCSLCSGSIFYFHGFSSVQLLSCVLLFATPWIAARQASLSITNSRS